jgi:3-isopropylmalate/(R)-2-methylmalate dehydratase large subunit
MKPEPTIRLTPGKRVLFLTKDPELIRKQLRGELDLQMKDLSVDDLLDDINTDAMTPAWVCFSHKPEDIARDAYAGLIVDGKRLFEHDALIDGNFEVIVSGYRKGVGSSRETATQCEVWSGIRIAVAASFAPIHAGNNINQGLLMANHAMLERLQAGDGLDIAEFCKGYDAITQLIIKEGGLFPFAKAVERGEVQVPAPSTPKRPMTMGEKILARHVVGGSGERGVGSGRGEANSDPLPTPHSHFVQPGDAVVVEVDGGYTHEFTTAQVHYFLEQEYGPDYTIRNPQKFAVFEDHLIYADDVARMRPFMGKIQTLRDLQREFQQHTGCRDFSAVGNISPGICHEVARELIIDPGDFIQATDSHTCMGGVNNALAWGVGATEYANLVHSGFTQVEVSESIRFELTGTLRENVTAKDVMLYILLHYAKPQMTLDRIMEFTGPGLRSLSMDERATLANMATECAARTAIIEADEKTFEWIKAMRPDADIESLKARAVSPDPDAAYAGGVHTIDLGAIQPMVAHPGDPDRGIPSDPTNGAFVHDFEDTRIDIAYAGSCTAGKIDDFLFYHQVAKEAVDAGLKVAEGVKFYIQFGSQAVETFARENGLLETFARAGAVVLNPGCGACIGCGPGVSDDSDQVTISAINRNYKGRSGPGKLWLASPLTVAASAFTGHVTAYTPGMFAKELVEA